MSVSAYLPAQAELGRGTQILFDPGTLSLPCLDLLLAFGSGDEDVLPDEAAFLHHRERVLETAQGGIGVVGSEGELCAGGFRLFDERSAGNLIAVVDLDGDVVFDGSGDDLASAVRGPEGFVVGGDLLRKERGIGVDVDGLAHDAEDAFDQHVHKGLCVGDGADFIVDPETHALAVIVSEGHGIGEDVIEAGNGCGRDKRAPFAAFCLQGDEAGLAFHRAEILLDTVVAVHGKAEAAVDGDAVVDAEAAGVFERLLDCESALEMHVVVDDGIVFGGETDDFAIEVVDFWAVGVCGFGSVGQRADADVAEMRGAARIVSLEGEGAVIEDAAEFGVGLEGLSGLYIVDDEHVVDSGLHALAANSNGEREPLVVSVEGFVDVADSVERAGLLALDVAGEWSGRIVFNLHFESGGRKTGGLEFGVEVDAGVGAGQCFDFGAKFKIPKIGVVDSAGVEEMRALAMSDDLVTDDFKGAFVLTGLPAIKGFAVEEGDPVGGRAVFLCPAGGCCGSGEEHGEDFAAR